MADFDKFLDKANKFADKGNDFLDKADERAKERQAMSENPEEEQQGTTVGDMVAVGGDMAKGKAMERLQDKFLNKDGDDLLDEGAKELGKESGKEVAQNTGKDIAKNSGKELGKDAAKNTGKDVAKDTAQNVGKDVAKDTVKEAAKETGKDVLKDKGKDEIKDKFLNSNPNADSILNKPKEKDLSKSNKDNKDNPNNKKNHFGDSKNQNKNDPNSFKKNPTAGKDAVKEGTKEAAKDGAKEGAKDAIADNAVNGDISKIAKNAAAGDMDAASDAAIKMGVEKGVEAAANAIAPGAGKIAGKVAGFATRLAQNTQAYKIGKYCCGIACLGIVGALLAVTMVIPIVISYIMKVIGEIVETLEKIPIVGEFVGLIRNKLTEILGLDFGDFDFEEIGYNTNDMYDYVNSINRFKVDGSSYLTTYREPQSPWYKKEYVSDDQEVNGKFIESGYLEEQVFDPDAIISQYLPLFKVYAALETVDKKELAKELDAYFVKNATNKKLYEFKWYDNVFVEYSEPKTMSYDPDNDTSTDNSRDVAVRIKTTRKESVLAIQKATTLTEILTFEWREVTGTDGETKTWEMVDVKSEPNYEVIAMFNKYHWTDAEIATFEYIADCNPINEIYDAGMYGFTSNFTMPVDDYRIAIPYESTASPYSETYKNPGIDIAGNEGTEVKAIANATVSKVGFDATKGYYVKLIVGSGNEQRIVSYYNLREQAIVAQGSSVSQGQVIGYMGSSASNGSTFLHMEVHDSNNRQYDPRAFLASTYTTAVEHVENDAQIGPYSMKSYKQYDYGPVGGVSMKNAACGPTSMAMVLSSQICGSQNVSPTVVASMAKSKGLWSSAGASWSMFKTLAPNFGLNPAYIEQISLKPTEYRTSGGGSANITKITNAISQNWPVIVLIHGDRHGYKSKFTNGGHYIVVDGWINSGTLARILDPASAKIERKQATLDELFYGAVQAYIFKPGVK